jgi:hypothetical protein
MHVLLALHHFNDNIIVVTLTTYLPFSFLVLVLAYLPMTTITILYIHYRTSSSF